eukprot:ctg_1322.g560
MAYQRVAGMPRHNVQMQVRYELPGLRTVVDQQVARGRTDRLLDGGRHRGHTGEHSRHLRTGHALGGGVVPLRHDQGVGARGRKQVQKRHTVVVFEHLVAGHLPADDFAEQAVGIGTPGRRSSRFAAAVAGHARRRARWLARRPRVEHSDPTATTDPQTPPALSRSKHDGKHVIPRPSTATTGTCNPVGAPGAIKLARGKRHRTCVMTAPNEYPPRCYHRGADVAAPSGRAHRSTTRDVHTLGSARATAVSLTFPR